jgi:putative endopeptidase
MGHDAATSDRFSQTLMAMETDLAKASRKLEATRDPVKNYNKMPVAELNKICPSVNWPELMNGMGVPGADTVILGQPEFMKPWMRN